MRIYRIFVFGCPRIVRASSRARCIVRGAAAAQASAPASLPVQPTTPPLSAARPPAFPYRRLACSHPACLPGPLQMPIGAPTHASVRMGGFTRVWSERESAVGPVRPTFFSAASRHCEPRRLGSAAPVGATQRYRRSCVDRSGRWPQRIWPPFNPSTPPSTACISHRLARAARDPRSSSARSPSHPFPPPSFTLFLHRSRHPCNRFHRSYTDEYRVLSNPPHLLISCPFLRARISPTGLLQVGSEPS